MRFKIADFVITDGKDNDGSYWKNKGFELSSNNLWIADLGYFSWDTLADIAESQNYFLSRYKTGTAIYIKNDKGKFELFDLESYVGGILPGNISEDIIIYFGKQKTQCRLICGAVPQEVKQQRLEKYQMLHARQSKSKKQWQMTAVKELLCGYNLYITNAPQEQLPTKDVFLIYGLRWQIELLFKIWKSLLFIDNVPPMNIFRFECFLYGRLIFILLSSELILFLKDSVLDLELDIEISEWKTMKILKKNYAA